MKNDLIKMLFDTSAFRVCDSESPFWYTSNKIGPYYINTHFLYGSEEKAKGLLKVIDEKSCDRDNCSQIFFDLVKKNYQEDAIYKKLIDFMVDYARENIDLDNIQFISGGERRDWFFSLIIADILKMPHITVFKDLSYKIFCSDATIEVPDVKGANILHIADIITEASSYIRAWVPAIKNIGGNIVDSLVVVDRLQGGRENLASVNVRSHALTDVDIAMIDSALDQKLIDQAQYDMVAAFINDPFNSMRNFLLAHPDFLVNAAKSDDQRTAGRAQICIKENLYNL